MKKTQGILTSPSLDLHDSMLHHLRKVVNHFYPPGWDSTVRYFYGRKSTKARWNEGCEPYGDLQHELHKPFDLRVDPIAVPDKGKYRVITKPDRGHDRFKSLQRSLWRRLKSHRMFRIGGPLDQPLIDWLNEDPDPLWASGDYESATDNLYIQVPIVIMQMIMDNSSYPLKKEAILEAGSHYLKNDAVQTRGQLMGSLLSFPLLCIANYAAFSYVFGFKKRVIINGDDILHKCKNQEMFDLWIYACKMLGFVMNEKKTYLSRDFATVNSTPIWKGQIRDWHNLKMANSLDGSNYLDSGLDLQTYKRRVVYEMKRRLINDTRDLLTPRSQGGLGGTTTPARDRLSGLSRIGHYGRLVRAGYNTKQSPPTLKDLACAARAQYLNGMATWLCQPTRENPKLGKCFSRKDLEAGIEFIRNHQHLAPTLIKPMHVDTANYTCSYYPTPGCSVYGKLPV